MECLSSEALQEGWERFGSGRSILGSTEVWGKTKHCEDFDGSLLGKSPPQRRACPFLVEPFAGSTLALKWIGFEASQQKSIPLPGPTIKRRKESHANLGECAREKYCRTETRHCWPDTMCIISPKDPVV